MHVLVTILFPFTYLRIRHPLKRVVDRMLPVVGALVSALFILLWTDFNMFGASGVIAGFNNLMQNMPGFYITSLAAIATFSGEAYRIDEAFEGEKALLQGDVLTRRQFLCLLFAYLCLISLTLYVFGNVGLAAASSLHGTLDEISRTALKVAFAALYGFGFAHLAGTTMIGLIFLAGRLPEPKVPLQTRSPQGVAVKSVATGQDNVVEQSSAAASK